MSDIDESEVTEVHLDQEGPIVASYGSYARNRKLKRDEEMQTAEARLTAKPNKSTKAVYENQSYVSAKSSIRLLPTTSLQLRDVRSGITDVRVSSSGMSLMACRYANCGCQKLVCRGTLHEQDHYQSCDYRPIPCILPHCQQLVPFHDFIFHLTKHHHIQPNYSSNLTSSIVIHERDFEGDTAWNPKWMATLGHQFFLMLQRKEPGTWASWVWMFGTETEAQSFVAKISFFRGKRFISGTFPVHSVRRPESVIESKKACILFTDQTLKTVSGIGSKIVTDLSVNVQIKPNTVAEGYGPKAEPVPARPEAGEMFGYTYEYLVDKLTSTLSLAIVPGGSRPATATTKTNCSNSLTQTHVEYDRDEPVGPAEVPDYSDPSWYFRESRNIFQRLFNKVNVLRTNIQSRIVAQIRDDRSPDLSLPEIPNIMDMIDFGGHPSTTSTASTASSLSTYDVFEVEEVD